MSNFELRGQEVKLKREIYAIDVRAEATVKGLRHLLAQTCIIEPIEEADVEQAASLLAELIELKGEKIRNLATLKKIKKELES